MTDDKQKKPGRKKGYRKPDSSDAAIPRIRVTKGQLKHYQEAYKKSQSKSFSAWVRDMLDKASKES